MGGSFTDDKNKEKSAADKEVDGLLSMSAVVEAAKSKAKKNRRKSLSEYCTDTSTGKLSDDYWSRLRLQLDDEDEEDDKKDDQEEKDKEESAAAAAAAAAVAEVEEKSI